MLGGSQDRFPKVARVRTRAIRADAVADAVFISQNRRCKHDCRYTSHPKMPVSFNLSNAFDIVDRHIVFRLQNHFRYYLLPWKRRTVLLYYIIVIFDVVLTESMTIHRTTTHLATIQRWHFTTVKFTMMKTHQDDIKGVAQVKGRGHFWMAGISAVVFTTVVLWNENGGRLTAMEWKFVILPRCGWERKRNMTVFKQFWNVFFGLEIRR